MMRALLVLAMIGCSSTSPCGPAPIWTVAAAAGPESPYGPSLHVRAALDGSLVAFFDVVGPAQLGPLAVDGPAFGRIGTDGSVERLVHVDGPGVGGEFRLDDSGAPIVVWVPKAGVAAMTRYDAAFNQQWSIAEFGDSFDIAPSGAVVYVYNTTSLHYLGPDGVELWKAVLPVSASSDLRMAANGDVFAFYTGSERERVHYRADGVLVDDVTIPQLRYSMPASYELQRDGGVVFVDLPYLTVVKRLDATGAVQWATPLRATTNSPVVTSTGDVAAVTDLATAVVRIDGATGAIQRLQANCHAEGNRSFDGADDPDPAIVTASASEYVLLETTLLSASERTYLLAAYSDP